VSHTNSRSSPSCDADPRESTSYAMTRFPRERTRGGAAPWLRVAGKLPRHGLIRSHIRAPGELRPQTPVLVTAGSKIQHDEYDARGRGDWTAPTWTFQECSGIIA
jgi:hypothetical protein